MKMPLAKYKTVIIECIDQLRQRKARPDAMRIAHLVARRHGLKATETETYLEQLVDSGDVLKVEFKGNTSYRVPSSSKSLKHGKKSLNSESTNKNILDALSALCGNDVDKGANFKEIEKWFNSSVDPRLTKQQLQIALDREASNGVIKKLENGSYQSFSELSKDKQKKAQKRKLSPKPASITEEANEDNSPHKRGRPLSKRKRIKKNHGPDFETFYEQRANSPGTSPSCDYCLKSTKEGEFEKILVCKDCNAQAHPSCMGYTQLLAKRALRAPWQCNDCKMCIVCEDPGDPDMMLFCDACDKGFHMNCHEPSLEKKPMGKWVCYSCTIDGTVDADNDIDDHQDSLVDEGELAESGGASCLPTPCDSPMSEEEEEERQRPPKKMKKKSEIKPSAAPLAKYPDASKWKVADVVNFFNKLGFKEQAASFQDQEIDGQSMLLLKRTDVLTGLNLKLGPALKIYQHVAKLQTVGIDLDDL